MNHLFLYLFILLAVGVLRLIASSINALFPAADATAITALIALVWLAGADTWVLDRILNRSDS